MEVPAWVTEKYGNVEIHRDEDPLYQVVDFIEKTDGQQNLGVYVSDDEGDPLRNVAVVLYFSTADPLEDSGWMNAGHVGFTDESGYVGFPMGGGAYYFPQEGQEGPHAVWVHGIGMSEMVTGLGMLGQTPYHHVDVHFCLLPTEPTPPQPPPPEPPPLPPTPPPLPECCKCEEIATLLKEILVELRKLAGGAH